MADETRKPTETDPGRGDSGKRNEGTAQVASDTAKKVWDDAKREVRSVVNERQRATADQIEDFAGALRGAADHVDADSTPAHVAEGAADALDRISRTLRSKEAGAIVRDLEAIARRQPALFLGAAVAAGFVAVRFLKSSGEHDETPAGASAPGERAQSAPAGTAYH